MAVARWQAGGRERDDDRHELRQDRFSAPRSRRDTLRAGGAFGSAAIAAMVAGPVAVFARSPSPATGSVLPEPLTGRYVVVRFRPFKAGQVIAAAQQTISEGSVPLNQAVPGFVSYFGSADPATGAAIYVGVFAGQAGADESNRIAAEWLTTNGSAFFEGDPIVYEGLIDHNAVAAG